MYDDAFDYVVANPPFTLWWEDRNFLYQNAKYGNRIISEMAVMEIGVRSLKQGGFLSIIMPSDVFEKKFINEKNFIAWLRKHANPVMKISLPSTTHEGTVWPTSLYIFQKNGHQSVNINVWWNEEQMIPPFKQYAQMDDFASDTITNIVNESNYDVGRHAIRYAEGIEPQSTFTLVHAEIKKLSAENYLTTSTDIKTNDVVTFDVSASNLETFDSIPIRLIPNGLHADLKTRSIKSRYPMEFSRAQRRYIDTFTEKIANLDELMDPRNPFEKKPLVQSIFSYDMDIGYSKRFMS